MGKARTDKWTMDNVAKRLHQKFAKACCAKTDVDYEGGYIYLCFREPKHPGDHEFQEAAKRIVGSAKKLAEKRYAHLTPKEHIKPMGVLPERYWKDGDKEPKDS